MNKNKGLKLSLSYTRKVTLSGENSLEFEKEFIVRRNHDQYAMEFRDGIRYIIFKDTKQPTTFVIIGRKMGGNKYKNYFLGSTLLKRIFSEMKRSGKKIVSKNADELDFEDIRLFLNLLLENSENRVKHFNDFVKANYGVDYDNSAS